MTFWRGVFAFAALVNLTVGLAMLFGADLAAERLGLSGAAAGYAVGFCGLMIAVFGVAYAAAVASPLRNRNFIALGVIGKVAAATFTALHHADLPSSTVMLGLSDLPFAAAFLFFLLAGPKPIAAPARA